MPSSRTATPRSTTLPQGAVVGTSSLRRVVQLRALRPDLRIEPLRGNLDTRLRKLDAGELRRDRPRRRRPDAARPAARASAPASTPARMLPAAGQGALGIEIRADATALGERLATLTHRPTWLAVLAERAVSRALGGSCSVPLAAHAAWRGARLELRAAVGDPDRLEQPLLRAQSRRRGRRCRRRRGARRQRRAQALLDQGARRLPRRRRVGRAVAGRILSGARLPRLIVTRPRAQAGAWVEQLIARGIDAVAVPLIEIAPPPDPRRSATAWAGLGDRAPGRVRQPQCGRALLRRTAGRRRLAGRPARGRARARAPPRACAAQGVPAAAIVAPAGRRAAARFRVALAGAARARLARPQRPRGARRRRPRLAGRAARRGGRHGRRGRRLPAARAAALGRGTAPRRRRLRRAGARTPGSSAAPRRSPTSQAPRRRRDRRPASRALATHPRIAARARQAGFGAVLEVRPAPRCGGRLHTIDATVNDDSSPAPEPRTVVSAARRRRSRRAGRCSGAGAARSSCC